MPVLQIGPGWDVTHPALYGLITLPPAQAKLEELSGSRFDSCLLNLYRDGGDNMGEHFQLSSF